MKRGAAFARSALVVGGAALLASCGGSKGQPPIEQIVVRQPGQAAAVAALTSDPGKAAFAICSACHAVTEGVASGVGPNLAGVFGRKAGSVEGFAYSDAMKGSAITWTESELDAYLADPVGKVPGTTMTAGAVRDAAQREAVIAYLKGLTG